MFSTYNQNEPILSPIKQWLQKAWVQGDTDKSARWLVASSLFIKYNRVIIELDDKNYSYCVIAMDGSREYLWIMYRHPDMPADLYDSLLTRLEVIHQFKLNNLRRVPQIWTWEERERRGLKAKEIPDRMLIDPELLRANRKVVK